MTKNLKLDQGQLPLISVCIPVFNEKENIAHLHHRLCKLADSMSSRCTFEFVFTDNSSTDDTWATLKELSRIDKRIRGVRFSRNIGFQNSIKYNYLFAKGDAVVQVDADLQDPPELISDFFDEWVNGAKVVSGLRVDRAENSLIAGLRNFGYRIIDRLSERGIQQGVGDFRLIDRDVVELIRKVRSPYPYLRGIISGFAFPETLVKYSRDQRKYGASKFGVTQTIKLGFTALLNHSKIVTRISSFLALITVLSALLLTVYLAVLQFVHPASPKGYTSLAVLLLLGFAGNAMLIGMLSSYVLKIYMILNGEENFTVKDQL